MKFGSPLFFGYIFVLIKNIQVYSKHLKLIDGIDIGRSIKQQRLRCALYGHCVKGGFFFPQEIFRSGIRYNIPQHHPTTLSPGIMRKNRLPREIIFQMLRLDGWTTIYPGSRAILFQVVWGGGGGGGRECWS